MFRDVILAALAVAIVSANQLENNVDYGQTVKEVENMLAKDPRLPRLTRGEILKLIDEVRTGKEVVVVLPDNQAAINDSLSTSSTTKRPLKRRRKKPVVRPVYVHTTTADPVGSTVRSTALEEAVSSSTERPQPGVDLTSTPRPRVKTTTTAPGGGLPPIPGLSLVEGLNSWGPVRPEAPPAEKNPDFVFITPVQPVATTTAPTTVAATTSAPTTAATTALPHNPEAQPNVKVAAESLGPEMKDLLTRFGLLGSETTTQKFYQAAPAPTIDPEVYSRFKPLPVKATADFVSPDMKSFLASFGLLDTRRAKDLKADSSEVKNSPLDYIPNRDKDVLSHLGLWRDGKAIDVGVNNFAGEKNPSSDLKNSSDVKNQTADKASKHVFKPKKPEETSSEEELKKVSKILTKLKAIGEGKEGEMKELSPSDVEELLLLEDNTRLAAQEQVGFDDQESLEEKNEVKRNPQGASASASVSVSADAGASATASASAGAEASSGGDSSSAAAAADSSSGGETTTSEVSSDTSVSTTTELASSIDSLSSESEDTTERGASAVDLADSFGGDGTTTTKRPNGFYFLLDWNSFLDVGLDDPPGRAIHLNFSPKVGNPANFLPVNIGSNQRRR